MPYPAFLFYQFSFLVGTYRTIKPVMESGMFQSWSDSTDLFYSGHERDVLRNGDTLNTITRMLDGIYFKAYVGNADLSLAYSGISIFSGYNLEPTVYSNIHNGIGMLYLHAQTKTKNIFFRA